MKTSCSSIIKEFDDSKQIFVTPKNRKNKLISIRFPVKTLMELKTLALKKGYIGYQQIIKQYVLEGLKKETP